MNTNLKLRIAAALASVACTFAIVTAVCAYALPADGPAEVAARVNESRKS